MLLADRGYDADWIRATERWGKVIRALNIKAD
jgi:hypothetical protein